MAGTKKWMEKLQKHEAAVVGDCNVHERVMRTPSPSVNFVFGNGWGLPFGYTMCLYGPPKAGKTLLINGMIGQLHQDDEEAIVLKYDTEFREKAQNPASKKKLWGIDPSRYQAYEAKEPELIFDHIAGDVLAMVQDGAPIRAIVIDSITGIRGRRAQNAESVLTQQIGDKALTIQDGLDIILPIIHRNNIALIVTTHLRAEMDPQEQQRGKKFKMAGAFALKHACEYFVLIEPNRSMAGRKSLTGEEFVNDALKDTMGHGEITGHKIRVKMEDSSIGPKGRVGEFTLDYNKGIINLHEEIFVLGKNRGVIERPNNLSYVFGGEKWTGEKNMIEAIRENPQLAKSIVKEVKLRDLQGQFQDVGEVGPTVFSGANDDETELEESK